MSTSSPDLLDLSTEPLPSTPASPSTPSQKLSSSQASNSGSSLQRLSLKRSRSIASCTIQSSSLPTTSLGNDCPHESTSSSPGSKRPRSSLISSQSQIFENRVFRTPNLSSFLHDSPSSSPPNHPNSSHPSPSLAVQHPSPLTSPKADQPILYPTLSSKLAASKSTCLTESTKLSTTSKSNVSPSEPLAKSKPSKLNEYTCVICMDPPKNLTITACGHLFCYACLIQALSISCGHPEYYRNILGTSPAPFRSSFCPSIAGRCPVCRKSLDRNRPRKIIPMILKKKKVSPPPPSPSVT